MPRQMTELRKELLELCSQIEALPAGGKRTNISLLASYILDKVQEDLYPPDPPKVRMRPILPVHELGQLEGHRYELFMDKLPNDNGCQVVQFIDKQPNAEGALVTIVNGTTNEAVLEMLIDRLSVLNRKVPCKENSIVLTHLETALLWLDRRTCDRQTRRVENTPKA